MNNKKHGGKRHGAGRKLVGDTPKRPLGVKVSAEAKANLVALSEYSGHSQAAIIEYLLRTTKELPTQLD